MIGLYIALAVILVVGLAVLGAYVGGPTDGGGSPLNPNR